MTDSKAMSLEDGAKGNARKSSADEVAAGGGGRVGAAGDVLLALLVEDILDRDTNDDRDWSEVSEEALKGDGCINLL